VILYICRHGEAEKINDGTSEEMHLTKNGETQVDRVSSLAKKLGMVPDVILVEPSRPGPGIGRGREEGVRCSGQDDGGSRTEQGLF